MAKRLKCKTPHCRRYASKGRTICATCKSRKAREANPVRYAYQTLRGNAKRRKVYFDLTYDEFLAFCIKTKVLHGRGRYSESYHIDRIEDEKGYTAGNLQVLTNRENLLKEHDRRRAEKLLRQEKPELERVITYDHQAKQGSCIYLSTKPKVYDNCPF